jgi:hypothetical protein
MSKIPGIVGFAVEIARLSAIKDSGTVGITWWQRSSRASTSDTFLTTAFAYYLNLRLKARRTVFVSPAGTQYIYRDGMQKAAGSPHFNCTHISYTEKVPVRDRHEHIIIHYSNKDEKHRYSVLADVFPIYTSGFIAIHVEPKSPNCCLENIQGVVIVNLDYYCTSHSEMNFIPFLQASTAIGTCPSFPILANTVYMTCTVKIFAHFGAQEAPPPSFSSHSLTAMLRLFFFRPRRVECRVADTPPHSKLKADWIIVQQRSF